MDTVKINLSWTAFSEIRDKFQERVLEDIYADNFYFTDDSVSLQVPAQVLDRDKATT